jgi:radical SAM protein with 4Fe4S-binding SPASM domain
MWPQLRDARQWMRHLNGGKAANAARLWSSYRKARRTRDPRIAGLPMIISVEPTTACNLRCPECPSGLRSFSRPTGNMRADLLEHLLHELAPTLWGLTFYFQGEPYINPGFLDMVAAAERAGVYTATSTNGHFLTEANAERTVRSGLSRLIVSIDGVDQETYSAYRKEGHLATVLAGVERLVAWKKRLKSTTPHVVFQFLVVRPNEHQVPQVRALARRMGADELWLKTAQVQDPRANHPLIPEQERYARYAPGRDSVWRAKNALHDHCWKMWHSCVITWNGRVVPCCFDKDAHFVLGNLQEQRFVDVWKGEAYRDFRAQLLTARAEVEMCRNCSEGSPVWA